MQPPPDLLTVVSQVGATKVPPGVQALADKLLMDYGNHAEAILFYGSCLRTGDEFEGLVDLYVLVNSYQALAGNWTKAILYMVLPPTVYYLEIPFQERVIRCKYSVITLADFQRGTSKPWFHSYLWGRFAQPTGVLYVRNDLIAAKVYAALAQAVLTFILRVYPLLPEKFDARILWQEGLRYSYRAELRAEKPDTVTRLFDADPGYFEQVTQIAMKLISAFSEGIRCGKPIEYHVRTSTRKRFSHQFAWFLRRIQGRVLSVMRLFKGMLTFQGGIDYLLWKISRHSGSPPQAPAQLHKHHSGLAMIVTLWRFYRRGAFR